MKLSVVIVNWNSKKQTRDCLDSFRKHCSDLDKEIIVVDGGSFDGCDKMIAKFYPEVTFVQSPKNIGFGRSNNLGASKATGDALLLINPDTEVEPGAVQHLLEMLQSLPCVGVIGPQLLNSDGSRQEGSVHAFPTPINEALDSAYLRRKFPRSSLWKTYEAEHSKNPTQVDAVGGACMMMWRSTFEKVGGFTPDYFMYAEDMDLCLKVHRSGLINYHTPHAKIWHHSGCSSEKQPSNFTVLAQAESLSYYFIINHGKLTCLNYKVLLAISSAIRISLLKVLSAFIKRAQEKSNSSISRWKATLTWCLRRSGKHAEASDRLK